MSTATKSRPKIRIHPLEDRVVILPFDEPEAMRGGLYIPDTAKEKPTQGEVLAVGPGRFEKGERIKMDVAVGEVVLTGSTAARRNQDGDDELIIIKASDILAKIG